MKQEPLGNHGRHGNSELHHVVEEVNNNISYDSEVGVAGDVSSSSLASSEMMSINSALTSIPPSSPELYLNQSTPMVTKCLKKLNKKHLFGVVLLMIVDVIWVGSAALTQVLFHQQKYDKPLFTVYFKTVLFTIYLLPFTFWRPWQRLCCHCDPFLCLRKKQTKKEINSNLDCSQDKDEDGSINNSIIISDKLVSNTNQPTFSSSDYDTFSIINTDNSLDKKEDLLTSISGSCVESSSFSTSVHDSNNDSSDPLILGPSRYTPTKFNDDEKFDTNSLTMPRKTGDSKNKYLTSSSTDLLCKTTKTNVRFCRTAEVKCVPSQYKTEREAEGSSSLLTPSTSQSTRIPTIPVKIVFVLALVFGIFWVFANYLYAKALETQSVAAVNTLSSLCSVFVLILSAIPFPSLADRDRFSLTKFILIAISVGGAVLIGVSPSSDKMHGISTGALYSLGGSALYAIYLVLLSKFLPHPESLEIPMFFGFVGLTSGLLFIPILCCWHYLEIESFELPPSNMAWTVLLVNGWVGTVLSELLWLWGCLLTSSLVGTLSLSLVTPLSIAYNMIFTSSVKFSVEFLAGAGIVLVVFILITLIDYFGNGSDPIWTLIKKTWHCLNHDSHRSYDKLDDESKDLLRSSCNTRPDSIIMDGSPPLD